MIGSGELLSKPDTFVWNEGIIAAAISRQTLARKCVVLVPNCSWTGYECDVLAVTTNLRIIDVEIKVSRADLRADRAKDKWWHRYGGVFRDGKYVTPPPTAREWPQRVWKHYYAMPADIWDVKLLDTMASPRSGVILMAENKSGIGVVKVVRRAHPNKDAMRIKPESVMAIARLANLRMWDAYDALARRR